MDNKYTQFMKTPEMMDALVNSSVSVEDARIRANEYAKMFSRNDEMKDLFGLKDAGNLLQKTFSGYAETPLLSTQYFNASVASYVSSFAGFMSIEKDFEQPNGLFYWFDVLGVTDMRSVIPNLGPDHYQDIQAMGNFQLEVPVAAQAAYSALVGRKLIPGTVRVKVQTASEKFELVDDGQGNFMAVAGKLAAGSVNYLNGRVEFTLATALTGEGSSKRELYTAVKIVNGTSSELTSNCHEITLTIINEFKFLGSGLDLYTDSTRDELTAYEGTVSSLSGHRNLELEVTHSLDILVMIRSKVRDNGTHVGNTENVEPIEQTVRLLEVLLD